MPTRSATASANVRLPVGKTTCQLRSISGSQAGSPPKIFPAKALYISHDAPRSEHEAPLELPDTTLPSQIGLSMELKYPRARKFGRSRAVKR